ncbi:MAG: TGS domain-containing protein, partial [Chloroflexi bacterium]|nr:TGS domain-containing protein [Chloroflexota bacterium]
SQIYDLYAVRAIVDTRENCYVTFGLIHELWHPVDGRFKDYIAKPKENGYQSIHTTVFCEGGKLTEFQIRSYEMHQVAEYGIASHWYYKQSGGASPMPMGKLRWIRQLLQLRQESSSAREFVDAASTELFPDQVFVFTPQGDVKDLPRGSTPVDFAYRIHTEVGHHCIGARVNGRLVPLSYILQNADVVEILTARGDHGPSQGWLDFVATSTARQRIQQWLRRRDRPENLARGKEVFERELRRVLRGPQDTLPVDILRDVAREFFHEDIDDFYVAIGCGEISVQAAANRVELRLRQQQPTAASSPASLGSAQGAAAPTQGGTGTDRRLDAVTDAGENYKIRVQGASGLVVRRALCCTPRPPDRIVAYLTRASGATVHRIDCTNVLQEDEPERLVPAEWERPVDNRQVVEAEVQITAKDRPGLLSDISGMVSDVQGNISQCSVRTDRYWAEFHVVFSVPRRDVLDQLLSRISRMDEVERVVNVG